MLLRSGSGPVRVFTSDVISLIPTWFPGQKTAPLEGDSQLDRPRSFLRAHFPCSSTKFFIPIRQYQYVSSIVSKLCFAVAAMYEEHRICPSARSRTFILGFSRFTVCLVTCRMEVCGKLQDRDHIWHRTDEGAKGSAR
jgi:hypothetical protein